MKEELCLNSPLTLKSLKLVRYLKKILMIRLLRHLTTNLWFLVSYVDEHSYQILWNITSRHAKRVFLNENNQRQKWMMNESQPLKKRDSSKTQNQISCSASSVSENLILPHLRSIKEAALNSTQPRNFDLRLPQWLWIESVIIAIRMFKKKTSLRIQSNAKLKFRWGKSAMYVDRCFPQS